MRHPRMPWSRRSLTVAVVVAAACCAAQPTWAGGFSKAQVMRLTQRVQTAMARQVYPGLDVGIWAPGKAYVRAFGLADTVDARAMRIGDRFRVGSITKTFLGTLILQLVGEDRLHLDDTLTRFYPTLPPIPNGAQITIRELLNHTSLIPDIAPWVQRQRLQFVDTGFAYDYGLGFMRVGDFCGHNGLIFGYDSAMFYSAQLRATIVILANRTPLLDMPPLKRPSDTANLAVLLPRIAFASSPQPSAGVSSPC